MEDTNVTTINSDVYTTLTPNNSSNEPADVTNNFTYNDISERYGKLSEDNSSNLQLWGTSAESIVYSLPENSSTPFSILKTTLSPATSTSNTTFDEFGPPEGIEYIFVPLGVMVFVLVLSAVVIIISRKRKLERLRHRLMPMYNFDPGEGEEDDWETELLDENYSSHQRRQGYQSMDTDENAELFGNY